MGDPLKQEANSVTLTKLLHTVWHGCPSVSGKYGNKSLPTRVDDSKFLGVCPGVALVEVYGVLLEAGVLLEVEPFLGVLNDPGVFDDLL